ncbi:MAG: hypothetical protein RIC19_10475 [Phaeodactylibacter sp.]|uniref:hypothetical protein n=1 Tax=Phaeodactylibacter sp. TaxID=1940289 RepID=UPI0032ECBF2F
MKIQPFALAIILIGLLNACTSSGPIDQEQQRLVSGDIDRFWAAYDQIQAEPDTARHLQILKEAFIKPASEGQQQLFAIRNYTPEEYLINIRAYPRFYASLRPLLEHRAPIEADIRTALEKFQQLYPPMQSGKIYLGMGNFRTNGTTVDSLVLFGAEMAFTDSTVKTSEFPPQYQYFKDYIRDYDPIHNVRFLAAHEFVHTQQAEAYHTSLLAVVLREGSAEFIAELCMESPSVVPAIAYGKANHDSVLRRFEQELFNQHPAWWVWSGAPNPFGLRDMGYYIGYALSEHYYHQTADKQKAIADLIELDYSDAAAVESFVDQMGYFKPSFAKLKEAYEAARPTVTRVEQVGNHFYIHFSEPMDTLYRGFDYGPLGEAHVLRIDQYLGFSKDGQSVHFLAGLTPGKVQELMIANRFRSREGIELQPYTITVGANLQEE